MSGFHPRDLINEVRIRPGIYNKEVLEHPTRDHKRQLWLEVAEHLTPADEWESFTDVEKEVRMGEIATKWKNLKDHFYREIKLEEAGEAHKKRKYVYYDDMEFVRPFVGYKLPSINKRVKSKEQVVEEEVEQEEIITQDQQVPAQEYVTNEADIDMEAFLNESSDNIEEEESKYVPNDSSVVVVQEEEVVAAERPKPKRLIKPTFKVLQNKSSSFSARSSSTPTTGHNRSTKEAAVIKNFNVLKKTDSPGGRGGASTNSTFKIRDGDITFCLSLVPTLRKLDDARKLSAKIEILKVLRYYVDNPSNPANVSSSNDNTTLMHSDGIDDDADEDDAEHLVEEHLEEFDENVQIKQETRNDPLNGNTKVWWT